MSALFTRRAAPSAPRVDLHPKIDKVLAAISFLIKKADGMGMRVTQYDIVKSLFVAERAHLNRYGRPITFDNYVAMYHGPVPSLSYDILKGNSKAIAAYDLNALPWKRMPAEDLGKGCFEFSSATNGDEKEVLSPSDIDALDAAFQLITSLSFGQVRKLTHSDPAYKEAWAASGERGSFPMSLGLLFDEPNFEAARVVEFNSRQSAVRESEGDDFDLPTDLESCTAVADW